MGAEADGGWITDPAVATGLGEVQRILLQVAGASPLGPAGHGQLLSERSKRLRPAVALLAARAGGGGVPAAAVRAAAVVELLHEATLYHDDIVDAAPVRRGMASAPAVLGVAGAALAGSELLYATVPLVRELPLPLRRAVARAGARLCRGQLRELEVVGAATVSVRERIRIMRDKTATLFELAARMGAVCGGLGGAPLEALVCFGRAFGLAYQLADDLRDLCVPAAALGRPRFADLRDGVLTLPVLFALGAGNEAAERVRAVVGGGGVAAGQEEEVAGWIREAGGVERAGAQLREWVGTAQAALAAAGVARAAATDLRCMSAALVAHAGLDGEEAEPRRRVRVAMAGTSVSGAW